MKICKYMIIGLFTTMISACSVDTPENKPDAKKIKQEVGQVLDDYVNQINTEGIDKVDIYFADDERFYWVEDGTVQYPDKASLIIGLKEFAPALASVNMEVSEVHVDVIDQDHAMLFVQYVEQIVMKSEYTLTLDGAMTILMERTGSTWKFLSGHSSVKKPRNSN